jgi:hypothetical protein
MTPRRAQFPAGRFRLTATGDYVQDGFPMRQPADPVHCESLPEAPRDEISAPELHLLQFAVGGRVYPPADRWIKITERFRGQVLRIRAQQVSGNPHARFDDLTPQQRGELQLLSGKDADGDRCLTTSMRISSSGPTSTASPRDWSACGMANRSPTTRSKHC